MATIILNSNSGIKYNNITLPGKNGLAKWGNGTYKDKNTGNDASARSTTEINDPTTRFINCIDIDWNSAQLSPSDNPTEGLINSTVNTTGQLLKNIENLQAQVNVLTILVKGLYNALEA